MFFAQEPSYRRISLNEGLPSSEAYCVIQDSQGYIWVSTDAGVCRFNGKKLTCFTTADGLKDNVVFNLLEDKKGRIWMTCYNGAVCYYEKGKITSIGASDSLMSLMKTEGNYITSFTMDGEGALWLGSLYKLIKISPLNNYKNLSIDTTFEGNTVTILKTFSNKTAVISGYDKILKGNLRLIYTKDSLSITVQCRGVLNFISRVSKKRPAGFILPHRCLMLKNGTVLFSISNTAYIYNTKDGLQQIEFDKKIAFFKEDSNQDIWIGFSKGGAFRYLKGNLHSDPVKYFTDKSVTYMERDHEGGIWLSTLENGICYIPLSNYSTFKNRPDFDQKITGLDAINDKVFVSNNSSRLYIINKDNSIDSISQNNELVASRNTRFYNFDNKVFVSRNGSGEIDVAAKKINYFTSGPMKLELSTIAMARIKAGEYLFSSGSNCYRVINGKVLPARYIPYRTYCILKTSDGLIHFGTKNGLYQLSGEELIPEFPHDSIFRKDIACMEQDDKGRLLLGTKQSGLLILKNGKYKVFGPSQGLPSAICTAILPDTNETAWIGTNKGIALVRLSGNNEASLIAIINTAYGLPSDEITRITRRGSVLYVGTKEGLSTIDLSLPFYNTIAPPVFIGAVYLNKKLTDTTSATQELDYRQNNFRFYIDCISFKNMFSQSYYYRLNGYDTSLQQSSAEFIEYTNLPPGTYTLEVIGLNSNNVRSLKPALYSFSIAKPFWLRGWFILLEMGIGAGLVLYFFRLRVQAVQKKEGEKTKINRMIAESQMTALRAQMNPHFIFNAINSIQNYILKEDTQEAYDYLAKFSKLIRMVLSNSLENLLTIEQELIALKLYVELEQLRFDEAFDFSVEMEQDTEDCLIPGMLLQPFVENAIWHGLIPLEGKRKGKVSIEIISDSNYLFISIKDNGVGIDRTKQVKKQGTHKSMGMMLSQNRLTILNQSATDKKYNILVEDVYNENKLNAGTKVTLIVPIIFQDEMSLHDF